jgi:hypothetical protein
MNSLPFKRLLADYSAKGFEAFAHSDAFSRLDKKSRSKSR